MRKTWDNRAPTVQLLGRWQPWHDGHLELFKRALAKTGQVCIMVRDVKGVGDNPFDFHDVRDRIIRELGRQGYMHGAEYVIQQVPNIVNITYGRDVGYAIERENLDPAVEGISATGIREEMRREGLLPSDH